jgi:hypothetical protein
MEYLTEFRVLTASGSCGTVDRSHLTPVEGLESPLPLAETLQQVSGLARDRKQFKSRSLWKKSCTMSSI